MRAVRPDGPPEADPKWAALRDRWQRESDALASSHPARAAELSALIARVALDTRGDLELADKCVQRGETLAKATAVVATARRWLAERRTKASDVLAAARSELTNAGDLRERGALLSLAAAIEAHANKDPEAAEKLLRERVALDPQDLGAWDVLATNAVRRKKFREATEAWEALSAATADPAMASAVHAAVGNLRLLHLHDPTAARASFERAIAEDPTNAHAQAALEPVLYKASAWIEYARIVVAQGDQVGEPATARESYEHAGDVLWECARDGASAAACFERAAAIAPRELAPLEKFAIVLEGTGRYVELPRVYERMLQVMRDPLQRAGVLYRLGILYETQLAQPDEAVRAYQRAVDAVPAFGPALDALLRLHRAHGRWAELAALLSDDVERWTDGPQRAARLVEIAELHEGPMARGDAAVPYYERALSLDALCVGAFDALDRIYRAKGEWDALVATYERLLPRVKDPRRLRALRVELAALLYGRVGQPERAATLLESTRGGEQDEFPTLVAMARAYADAGKWAAFVEVLEAQVKLLRDEPDIVAMLLRIASHVRSRLDDDHRALAVLQRVLERAPRCEPALRMTSEIQRARSRWDDAVGTERKILELVGLPDVAAATLFRIGRLLEDRLGRVEDAIRAYEEAVVRQPAYTPAFAALERLLHERREYGKLGALFERQALGARDAGDRARALSSAAVVYELHMKDLERAASTWDKVLVLAPGSTMALSALVRIQYQRGDWRAHESALRQLLAGAEHSGARLRFLVRLARVHEERLATLPQAAVFYEEALQTSPRAAYLAFDRLRVARAEGALESIATWSDTLAGSTSDPRWSLALARESALSIEYEGATPADCADAYARALVHAGDDPAALDGFARSLGRMDGDARLPAVLRTRAWATPDVPTRTVLLVAAGMLHEKSVHGREAQESFREALDQSSSFLPAMDGMRRLHDGASDVGGVAAWSMRAGQSCQDLQNRSESLLEAGELFADRIGDAVQALSCFRAVLEREPGHRRAFARALQLLEARNDHAGMAAAIAQHVEVLDDDVLKARLLGSRAILLADRLGEVDTAIADLRRALALRPDEPVLLAALGRFLERTQQWQDAAQAYEQLARTGGDAVMRREAALAQVRIWTEHVRDDQRALQILEALHSREPADRHVTSRLADVCVRVGDASRARDLYRELSRDGAAPERAKALLALAEVYRVGLNDLPAAHASAGEALMLATGDPAVVPMIEQHYERTADFGAFATLGEESLGHAVPNSPGVLAMRMCLSKVYRERLRSVEASDRHLRAAIDAFPNATEPRVMLAFNLIGGNDHAAVVELRRILDIDPCNVQAFRGLLSICQRVGLPAAGAIVASALALLGDTGAAIDTALAMAVNVQPLPGSLPPDEALSLLVGPTRARFVRRVAAALDPFVHEILPGGQEALAGRTRIPDAYPAATRLRAVGASLNAPNVALYRNTGREPLLALSDPRALLLGADHLNENSETRLLFDGAGALARIAAASSLTAAVSHEQLLALLDVSTEPVADLPGYRELRKKVGSVLPRRARKDLERIVEEGGGDVRRELPLWEDEERSRAVRLGVLFCKDMRVAAQSLAPEAAATAQPEERRRLLAAVPAMADALRFCASEACWGTLRRLFGQA